MKINLEETRDKQARLRFLGVMVVLLLCASPCPAIQMTEEQVKAAVLTLVRHDTTDAKPDAEIEQMEAWPNARQPAAYIAHLKGGGFCLCGADDLVLPVYLYNPRGRFDPAITDYDCILEQIHIRLTNWRQALVSPTMGGQPLEKLVSERTAYWRELIAGRMPAKSSLEPSSGPDVMELPLTDMWTQDSPYNDHCPTLVPGLDSTRTVVGCPATSASEVMYYWKWPLTGVGSATKDFERYYSADWVGTPLADNPGDNIPWSPSNPGQGTILKWVESDGGMLEMKGYWDVSMYDQAYNLSNSQEYRAALHKLIFEIMPQAYELLTADFGFRYDWNLMRDEHTDPPDIYDREVAKLCFHAGIAIQVRYGIYGTSGGYQDHALETYFRYDGDATNKSPVDMYKLTSEIQWLRPAILLGSCPGGGHAWVVYGYNKNYDPNRRFLMNMGHGPATSRMWYTIDGSGPQECDPSAFVYLIAPENVVRFVDKELPYPFGDGSPSMPHKTLEEAIGSAPDDATIILQAGTLHTLATHPYTISKPLTLKGYNVIIQ